MRSQFNTAVALLLGGFAVASAAQSQQPPARPDASQLGSAGLTSNIPSRSGEASTMVNGKPNANPDAPTLSKSRSEIRAEKELKKAQRKQQREMAVMGQKGAHVGAEVGNPSVLKGGAP